jgi:NAD(P)-dependent dehydrogenase (short-subunit alcohol dehydrogenase family)
MRNTLNVNVAGSVSVTEAILPLLHQSKSPRLVFVSSSTGSLSLTSDLGSPRSRVGRVEYRASKAALNFVMVQYWLALKDKGFVVAGADPGLNATGLTGDAEALRQRGAAPPEVGAERVAKVVRGEREEFAGRVCGEYEGGVVCPW